MSITLQRIDKDFLNFDLSNSDNLNTKNERIIGKAVAEQDIFSLELNVLLAQIVCYQKKLQNLTQNHSNTRISDVEKINTQYALLKRKIDEAIILSDFLAVIYAKYLDDIAETARIDKIKAQLNQLISTEKTPNAQSGDFDLTKTIRTQTGDLNPIRLFMARLRRLLLGISLITASTSNYNIFVDNLSYVATPFLAYFAWIIFAPRLFVNLAMLLKHAIYHDGLTEHEKKLSWQQRFMAQFAIRWPDLANDSTWFVVGVLNCFVIVGALAPFAIYLSFVLQIGDVVFAAIRMYIDLQKYKKTREQYASLAEDRDMCPNEINEYLQYFDQQINYETRALAISLANASLVLISLIIVLPILTINPIFAIIGGAIAVLTSGLCVASQKINDNYKPDTNIASLKRYCFFAKEPVSTQDDASPIPTQAHIAFKTTEPREMTKHAQEQNSQNDIQKDVKPIKRVSPSTTPRRPMFSSQLGNLNTPALTPNLHT